MMEFNKKHIWLLSIVGVLILFTVFLINRIDNNGGLTINNSSNKYNIVKDHNKFFTVNSCVYRYLTYLQSNDADSLLKVLDSDFINKNNINQNNIFSYLTMYDGNLNFNSRKMYEEELSDNITKYYVYGYVEKDVMDSFPEQSDAYFIVILDSKDNIFSIQPYNGDIFK